MDYGGDIPFRPAELVLQGGIQCSRESTGVDALPVVFHGFYNRTRADVAGLFLCSFTSLVSKNSLGEFSERLC